MTSPILPSDVEELGALSREIIRAFEPSEAFAPVPSQFTKAKYARAIWSCVVAGLLEFDHRASCPGYRLTPLGLAVRSHLLAQEKQP